jgi:integrase
VATGYRECAVGEGAQGRRRRPDPADLRHFHATQLLDAGVPVPTVATRVGHSDGTTTMKMIYAHRTRRADEHAAAVVADIFAAHDER